MNFVDLETARAARGVRIVASAIVPSPWSEAAKALFTLAKVPFVVVRATPRDPAIGAWTGTHNVPAVFHDDEPVRSVWSQILALAARLGDVLPRDPHARAATTGLIHEIAGEDGLGWNARLMMIHAGLTTNGERGFAPPAATYLAAKYGYHPERIPAARTRAIEVLAALGDRLGTAAYFGGDRPDALDAYVATFLTPLGEIRDEDCPGLSPPMRIGLAAAAAELAAHVPPSLTALRARMYERHLEWPIVI